MKGPEREADYLLPVKIAPWVGLLELRHQVRLLDVLDEVILANLKQKFSSQKSPKPHSSHLPLMVSNCPNFDNVLLFQLDPVPFTNR